MNMKFMNVNKWAAQDANDGAGSDLGGGVVDTALGGDTPEAEATPEVTPEAEPAKEEAPAATDWREERLQALGLEAGSEDYTKRLNQLKRFTDEGSVVKSLFEAQDKIRKGEVSNGLPENATDEQLAEYRKANGIPASAEEYVTSEGLVLGEADTRIMGAVHEVALANNIPAEAMAGLTDAMMKAREVEDKARTQQDGVDRQACERALTETWGQEMATNKNMINGMLNQLPADVKDGLAGARMPDGSGVFNNPSILMAFSDWARKLNPAATVVDGSSSNPVGDINTELKALEAQMGTEEWASNKEGQARYLKLTEARQNMK